MNHVADVDQAPGMCQESEPQHLGHDLTGGERLVSRRPGEDEADDHDEPVGREQAAKPLHQPRDGGPAARAAEQAR